MKLLSSRIFWGLLLIGGGTLFLLQSLLHFELSGIFWGAALALVGVAFLSIVVENRSQWWALFPGLSLLISGVAILLRALVPDFTGAWIAAVAMAGIGLAFWSVYLINRANWWAIIPGGVLLTIAVVTVIGSSVVRGAVFFVGLGVTFALVGVLPNPHGRMSWAFIPALILALMGLLTLGFTANIINYIWPVALILLGLWLVWRTMRRG